MRYFIIINPPEYRNNRENTQGYAWAGEAEGEEDAKLKAIAECEALNGFEHKIDAADTDVIEFGPDYKSIVEYVRQVVAKTKEETPGNTNWLLLQAINDAVTF